MVDGMDGKMLKLDYFSSPPFFSQGAEETSLALETRMIPTSRDVLGHISKS